jgi:AmmeMemoRadiSam system protein B/AmmeMemoRadiSam system protein A
MQAILIVLLSISAIMEPIPQDQPIDRQSVAAGRFYVADKETLIQYLSQLFENCKKSPKDLDVRAIISPHAGYVYSGKIAASAFASISKRSSFKNIFIIGSSHVMSFNGASVYNAGNFITPIGKTKVNDEIAKRLKYENKVFGFQNNAHLQEHSIEVQLPFIQYYFDNNPLIVPIIIGTNDVITIKLIADALRPWFTSENLFVISSDFSHYPSDKDANVIDSLTVSGLESCSPVTFLNTLKSNSEKHVPGLVTSMCGWTSGLTLLYLINGNSQLEFKLIDYCNSGDYKNGSNTEVVGYHAIALIERSNRVKSDKNKEELSFTEGEKSELFTIAKNAISSKLYERENQELIKEKIPEIFKKSLGAFVTLKINGTLRGCIGRFVSTDPLYDVVKSSAISSAFEDPRFSPLTKEEFEKTEFEITVLGPLIRISNTNEIIIGKHGIYIKKGSSSGTMLPQVATENGWTVEQFLGYTSRDKAGLGWDGWKDAELFIYEGVVLEDKIK